MWYDLRKNNNCKKNDSGQVDIPFNKSELKNYLLDDDSE